MKDTISNESIGIADTLSAETKGAVIEKDAETMTSQEACLTNSAHQSDEEFEGWFLSELMLAAPQVHELYPDLFVRCSVAVTNWRKRYRDDRPLWLRLFRGEKVVKEVVESIPVISLVEDWMDRHQDLDKPVTIIDLCSGKGFLSMLLSEILPVDRVSKCFLIDKAWPMCHGKTLAHHVSWEHIYGSEKDAEGPRYYETWPIPLVTSKVNLNKKQQILNMINRFSTEEQGPVLILAVHLCGILSIRALNLFRMLPTAQFIVLKPCCLPDIRLTRDLDEFEIGSYRFPTREVCSRGKWKAKTAKNGSDSKWEGPARWKLKGKFDKWCFHLFEALNHGMGDNATLPTAEEEMYCRPVTSTRQFDVPLQTNGGFQNTFLYAER